MGLVYAKNRKDLNRKIKLITGDSSKNFKIKPSKTKSGFKGQKLFIVRPKK